MSEIQPVFGELSPPNPEDEASRAQQLDTARSNVLRALGLHSDETAAANASTESAPSVPPPLIAAEAPAPANNEAAVPMDLDQAAVLARVYAIHDEVVQSDQNEAA